MHTTQHTPATSEQVPARVTLLMSAELRDRLAALAEQEHRSLSAQCVVLIQRGLSELASAA